MPEHTITETRGRNKWGHRSYDTKRHARFPSPVRLVVGNCHELRDWGRGKLNNRVSRRYQIRKDVERSLRGGQKSDEIIETHLQT